ncbi:MAG: 2-hydroxy-3-oxopropionate reductase [Subtercola sp.]|nr:2-hydroxy-3-oxopropionate reductase [Subtercola sp.]
MTAPIGFVGAGVMGSQMVRRLLQHGHGVLVFARTPAKVAELVAAGAECTNDLLELSDQCEVVIGCLLDDSAVAQVYLGASFPDCDGDGGFGLVTHCQAGQTFIEHGTFSPDLARRISRVSIGRGARFVDAPVTGGPEGAEAGSLVVMAGADEVAHASAADSAAENVENVENVEQRIRRLCAAYAREVYVTGAVGSGLALKLVNQLLVSVHMAAAAEAGALLAGSGIQPDVAVAVLGAGWGASTMLDRELPLALRGDFTNRGASIAGLIHVQELIATAFSEAGIAARLLPMAQTMFSEAIHLGLGGSDPAALVRLYDKAAVTDYGVVAAARLPPAPPAAEAAVAGRLT